MSSLICCLALEKPQKEMNWKQYTPRRNMQPQYGEEPHAYVATYRREFACHSSFLFWNFPDFDNKDESGNALLVKWLAVVFTRFGPQDGAKIQISEGTAKQIQIFFWFAKQKYLQPQVKVRICEGKAVETSHWGFSTQQTAVLRPASFPFATRKLPLFDE